MRTLLVSIGLLLFAAQTPAAEHNGRNVIIFICDDLGFQLGCYGDKVSRTPNIDRLAGGGVRFTRAACTTASCSASRSVLLTGLHNHATGHYGHAHDFHHFSTFSSVKSLPVMMSEAGYRTCSIGKYHLAPEAVYHFDEYHNQGIVGGARNPVQMADRAIEWMGEASDKPFFLYLATADPHRGGGAGGFGNPIQDNPNQYPGCEPVRFNPDDMVVPPWLPDSPEVKQELAEYYEAIARVDQGVGKLLTWLEQSGRAKDTLLLFLSDNGPPFPGAKTSVYEPGMHLPLIVRSPDVKQLGGTCDARVSWIDVVPTVLDFCQVTPKPAPPIRRGPDDGGPEGGGRRNEKPVPLKFHGRSFLSVLDTPKTEGWDELYASHTFHEITMYYPMRVVIDGRWKLIFNIASPLPYPFATDIEASPTWQAALKRNDRMFAGRTIEAFLHRPRFELYDLEADPWEVRNLSTSAEHAETLKRLQQKLQGWQKATNDPWESKWRYE
jgi:N-sulfoglucosamine sulfohydrolase